MASEGSSKTQCSEDIKRAIYGTSTDKGEKYDASLKKWWEVYAARKNDEEEHVADSLLYDERCTLPRTVQRPEFDSDPSN